MDAGIAIQRAVAEKAARAAADLETKQLADAKQLALDLNVSNAEAVFELLQYADGCSYTKARQRGEAPKISFHLFHDKLIVQHNDDGLNKRGKQALCSGTSASCGAFGYVGDRRLGIRSVFTVAKKVRIQSGKMSFSLNDSQLGMMVPADEPNEPDVNGCTDDSRGTCFTLYLQKDEGSDRCDSKYEELGQQLKVFRREMVLFMRALRSISSKNTDGNGTVVQEFSINLESGDTPNLHIITTRSAKFPGEERKFAYYVFRELCLDLPKIDIGARSKPADSLLDRFGEVILAFPANSDLTPQETRQNIFSFFPVEKSGFNFIIQANFVTDASTGLISDFSQRNGALLDAALACLRRAALDFRHHPLLQYHWMKWLPDMCEMPHSPPWVAGLMKKIRFVVNSERLFQFSDGSFTKLEYLRQSPDWCQDDQGRPLWPDLIPRRYPAPEYDAGSLKKLRGYGLLDLNPGEILDRVEADVNSLVKPGRYADGTTSDSWHSRAAKCLCRLLEISESHDNLPARIKSLKLIPLQDPLESWSKPPGILPIHFPVAHNLMIPKVEGLELVALHAMDNPERVTLFKKLGVHEAAVQSIRSRIFKLFGPSYLSSSTLSTSVQHLQFLYLTEGLLSSKERGVDGGEFKDCKIFNSSMKIVSCRETIYMPSTEPNGPSSLLGTEVSSTAEGVSFLHSEYLTDDPAFGGNPEYSLPLWKRWLCDRLSIRSSIRIVDEDHNLSPEFRKVVDTKPERIVGILMNAFNRDAGGTPFSTKAISEIANLPVPCMGGRSAPLPLTYLPTESLISISKATLGPEKFYQMNFLLLRDAGSHVEKEVRFLIEDFSVGVVDDINYYVDLLDAVLVAAPDAADYTGSWLNVLSIYLALQRWCEKHPDPAEAYTKINDHFHGRDFILVPDSDGNNLMWISSLECRWYGPPRFKTAISLRHIYEKALVGSDFVKQMKHLDNFFKGVLKNPKVTWEDMVAELQYLKGNGAPDQSGWCTEIYESLNENRLELLHQAAYTDTEEVSWKLRERKKALRETAVVYLPRRGESHWYQPSECVWSDNPEFRGPNNVASLYSGLKSFFVEYLEVPVATVQTLAEELKKKTQSDVEGMRATLQDIADLLGEGEDLGSSRTPEAPHPNPTECFATPSPRVKQSPLEFGGDSPPPPSPDTTITSPAVSPREIAGSPEAKSRSLVLRPAPALTIQPDRPATGDTVTTSQKPVGDTAV